MLRDPERMYYDEDVWRIKNEVRRHEEEDSSSEGEGMDSHNQEE